MKRRALWWSGQALWLWWSVATLCAVGAVGCDQVVEVGSRAGEGPSCVGDVDCSDGVFCNGPELCEPGSPAADARGCVAGVAPQVDDGDPFTRDACDEGAEAVTHTPEGDCQEVECAADVDCDEQLTLAMCQVAECVRGQCQVAMAPVGAPCEDGIGCTEDACDEEGACVGSPVDSGCFDPLYCNGLELCDPTHPDADDRGCAPGLAPEPLEDDGIPCTVVVCDEDQDTVAWAPGPECGCQTPGEPCPDEDGGDCTIYRCSAELTCEPIQQAPGTLCDDSVACTDEDICDVDGVCVGSPSAEACDDGAWCDGVEFCEPDHPDADDQGCRSGAVPNGDDGLDCTQDVCNEDTDGFDHIPSEDCACAVNQDCLPAEPSPCLVYTCGQDLRCEANPAPEGADCDDGLDCTNGDTCDGAGRCVGVRDDEVCNNGAWCDGVERCDPDHPDADGRGCHETAPPGLSDGVACTEDGCAECDPEDPDCDPGLEGQTLHQPGPDCACATDQDCAGMFLDQPCHNPICDGDTFTCQAAQRTPGAACDDGLDCTTDTTCDDAGQCLGQGDDGACGDGAWCNGEERCEPGAHDPDSGLPDGCAQGPTPVETWPDTRACLVLSCDEDQDVVVVDDSRCNQCMDTTVYADVDADGYGQDDQSEVACLLEGEPADEGYARDAGDCGPVDPWRHPGSSEICGDWVDDDCDDADSPCPTTSSMLELPDWTCEDDNPPSDVYAWARFETDPAQGGCFVFFRADSGALYATWRGLVPGRDLSCGNFNERLYGFTLAGTPEGCDDVEIEADFSGDPELAMQPVSNHCRKFLGQLGNSSRLSYAAPNTETLARRLQLFPNLEAACVGYRGWSYGWQSLNSASVTLNPGYVNP